MGEVAVVPPVVGDCEEDVELQVVGGVNARLEVGGDVVVAEVDGVLAHRPGAVALGDGAYADAYHTHSVVVGEVASECLSPDLGRAVERFGADVAVGEFGEIGRHLVVVSGGYVGVRRDALEAAYGVAAGREDDTLDSGAPGGLEDVVGAQHVAVSLAFPVLRAEVGGEMDDGVLALERGQDRVQVGDVGADGANPLHFPAIEGREFVAARFEQMVFQDSAYQSAHSGNQDSLGHADSPVFPKGRGLGSRRRRDNLRRRFGRIVVN